MLVTSGVVGLTAALTVSPRLLAIYQLYWGQQGIKVILYDDLGFGDAWSSLIAVIFSFFYALAWVPLFAWTTRLLMWKFSPRQLGVAFICWITIYGHAPLAHALLGFDTCFNQTSGQPLKWYVVRRDGDLLLFDSPGFDPELGVSKLQVSAEVCEIYRMQKRGIRPKPINADSEPDKLFGAAGKPRAWYYKTADGTLQLYDAPGFHPTAHELLLPITVDVVEEMRAAKRKRTAFVDQWAQQDRERLDRLFSTCGSVPQGITRLIVIPTELTTEKTIDLDLRPYIDSASGIAIVPSDLVGIAAAKKELSIYNQRPELSSHGPELFLQIQNARTEGAYLIGQNRSLRTDSKVTMNSATIYRVSIIQDLDIEKSDTDEVRYRILGKKPNATQWRTFGAGLNGKCYVVSFVVL